MIENRLHKILNDALEKAYPASGETPILEVPADEAFGDFATNVALVLSGKLKQKPREVAEKIKAYLEDPDHFLQEVQIAGPGFLNFRIAPSQWISNLEKISAEAQNYGKSNLCIGKRALVEFVSANPTGPLHIGHGRNAVVGDCIARLLTAVGYTVTREYYINDGGIQIQTLGKSVLARLRQLQGEEVAFPEEGYQGDYIRDIARELNPIKGDEATIIHQFGTLAGEKILKEIQETLANIQVQFDAYFQESSLYKSGVVEQTLTSLKQKNLTEEKDGALWLQSSKYGDDKDRVLIKSDGSYTYLTPDIAYHADKIRRGFDLLVNVWGADHAGYAPRLRAALLGLGVDVDSLKIVLIQMVNLLQDGEQVSMSTRRATYETLDRVVAEVGSDVARYFFMMRSYQAQLDFDLELAKKRSQENPVFYVQYAHARICRIFEKAGILRPIPYQPEFSRELHLPEEIRLAKLLLSFPKLIESAAFDLAPHRLATYAQDLVREFQTYYDRARVDERYRVVGHPHQDAKIFLLGVFKQVLANVLGILGVSCPSKM